MTDRAGRIAMYNRNKLKLGVFGANCSSGRAATKVPERWPATWDENLRAAVMADEAGMDFVLPVARWKGYGGETNFEGTTLETITWATGLLANTKQITVFGTVHAPLVHPVFAAKQFVTADHIGSGRFALNLVCGWNQDEFEMFGVNQRDHESRYEHAAEWLDVIKRIWSESGTFDYDGTYIKLKGVHAEPKPYGGTQPLTMNAGASPTGRAFAARNCDFMFTLLFSLEQGAKDVVNAKALAREIGREIGVFTAGYVVCRPTQREADEYHRYYVEENADWAAVDRLMLLNGATAAVIPPDRFEILHRRFAGGHGSFPMAGDPDQVAKLLAGVSEAGYSGIAFSFVNYNDEFPYFRDEVLPRLTRLGLREELAVP